MESRLVFKPRLTLEITLDSTGVDRVQAAREALWRHYLQEDVCEVVFINPTTSEVRE